MKTILCLLGVHDWVRQGGVYNPPPAELAPPPMRPDGLPRPPPTGLVSERFEQCFRCSKTRWGWACRYEPRPPPTPKPLGKEPGRG